MQTLSEQLSRIVTEIETIQRTRQWESEGSMREIAAAEGHAMRLKIKAEWLQQRLNQETQYRLDILREDGLPD